MTSLQLEFLAAVLLIELTPGPNMTWLALIAATQGRLAGYMALLGVAIGLSLLAVLSGLGIAVVVQAYPLAYQIIRWAGVLYLLYLAAEAWFQLDAIEEAVSVGFRNFWRGFWVNLLNPKAASIFIVLLPNFIVSSESLLRQSVEMSAMYVALATAIHLLIVSFASSFHHILGSPIRRNVVSKVFAVLLVVVAVWFAVSTAVQSSPT